MDKERELEKINNSFALNIAEIQSLRNTLDVNANDLKVLAIKELESGKTLIIDGRKYVESRITDLVIKEYLDWSNVKSIIVEERSK